MDWNTYFMNMVYLVAEKSKDKRAHIGAVIVGPNHEIRSTGYNGFPRGINDNVPERQEKPEKFNWFAHAEVNAIYNAARMGTSLNGCTLYTNGIPCPTCAGGVINAGIKEVIVDKVWNDENKGGKWDELALRSHDMFNEAKIKLAFWTGDLLPIRKFRRGQYNINHIDIISEKINKECVSGFDLMISGTSDDKNATYINIQKLNKIFNEEYGIKNES